MAEAPVEASLNEGALKRFDPYIKEIIDTAKYVALYSFVDNVWTKTKVEGSLFVYARSADPLYNILVLNRLDSKNLVEPITPQLDLQRNEPYLLYRNSEGNIFGIWFFDVNDCVRLTNLIQRLMDRSASGFKPQVMAQNNGQGVDIFRMLTQAQEAFSAKEGHPIPPRKQSPREMDGTPKSVAEFFAKAGSAPNEGSILSRTKSISESDQSLGVLQQLMANPAHSVEHIEKQQRVVTPHSSELVVDPLKQFLPPRTSGIDFLQNSLVTEGIKPQVSGSNGFARLAFESSPSHPGFSAAKENKIHQQVSGPNGFINSSYNRNATPPGIPTTEGGKKPDLMPPAMFTPKETAAAILMAKEAPVVPEPLTRNQLFQAFDYLLRNDPEFMNKLHEAYVKSLTDKIF